MSETGKMAVEKNQSNVNEFLSFSSFWVASFVFSSFNQFRYVGKDYSAAQELMEDEMKEYYSKNPKITPVQAMHVGQLLAVNAEEDAWLRAQIISMDENKIKASTIYFVIAL